MKKTIKYVAFFCLILIISFLACNPDKDDTADPGDPRDKYLGTWNVNETCNKANYQATITKDPSHSAQVLISNFCNPGQGYAPAYALVVGNTINVESQIIGDNWTVSGSGSYKNENLIQWSYTLVIAGSGEDCTADYTK
ncbi:MAG: hypothetical protein KAV44_10680 [Bacteroidales bacterium]|nr:hypothetical protein [Bacteroidales bacterium]